MSAHLALVRGQRHYDLAALAQPLRTAARDSALVAIVGRLHADDLRLLADAQPRARSASALGILLDVDSWSEPLPMEDGAADAVPPSRGVDAAPRPPIGPWAGSPVDGPSQLAASAGLLRAAGWRVVVVRRGMPAAQVWRLLLAGLPAASYAGAVLGR
jgi:hypothetical protein